MEAFLKIAFRLAYGALIILVIGTIIFVLANTQFGVPLALFLILSYFIGFFVEEMGWL